MNSRKTVLIVDDDDRNIFALSAVLRAKNFHVISETDGRACLETLKSNSAIDIVLMDVMMPIMDGYEATQSIRADKTLKNIPIIALTANAMVGDKEKCIKAGANDYCSKPVNIDELMEKISNCLKIKA